MSESVDASSIEDIQGLMPIFKAYTALMRGQLEQGKSFTKSNRSLKEMSSKGKFRDTTARINALEKNMSSLTADEQEELIARNQTLIVVDGFAMLFARLEDLEKDILSYLHDDEPSTWPLFYRTLGVSPSTPRDDFAAEVEKAYAEQGLKHDPKLFPNDPQAPIRWAAINKAYDVLREPGRRLFYDWHDIYSAPRREIEGFEILDQMRKDEANVGC